MPVFRMLPWKPIIAAVPVVFNNSKLRSAIRPSLRLTGQLKLLRCKILLTTQYNHCERALWASVAISESRGRLPRCRFAPPRNDRMLIIPIPLFFPRIAVVVGASRFPEAGLILFHEEI